MDETNGVADIIGIIESEQSAHDPVKQEEIADAKAEGGDSTPEPEAEKPKEDGAKEESKTKTEDDGQQETGKPDEGKPSTEATPTESDAHSKENKTDAVDWKATLPPPPPDYAGKEPEIDPNTGQITNMTPQEYQTYVEEKTGVNMDKRAYNNLVEVRALDAAEQILPDIKTNPNVRLMVQNTRIASILSGNQIDTVQAAKQVAEALGITSEKIQQAKAEGANNTKASIEIQKNAALETGSAKKGESPDKTKELQKRIARGDDLAFAELLDIIDKPKK
jgi:hypothetical protein